MYVWECRQCGQIDGQARRHHADATARAHGVLSPTCAAPVVVDDEDDADDDEPEEATR